ncbi:MAG: GxxExxY protein, partial [Acidobacteria bacterium]|nr:GxxExxY protein [Acidobacteriota bacterium]
MKRHATPASRKVAKAQSLAKEGPFTENEIASVIVDVAYQIHVKLGPGLLESVYEIILAHELRSRDLKVERQSPIPTTSHEDKQLLNKSGHFNYNTSSPRGGGNRSAARNQNRTRL